MAQTTQTGRMTIGQVIPPKARRMVAGGAIGTLMEYYDYYLYGLASGAIFPDVFFPSDDPVVGMLKAFLGFAFGFLLRPVGGILFGYIGDRFGRKRALMITVVGMGAATTAIGLIPPAHSIGILAPVILLLCRAVQGLFVGGEMGPAATLVVEHAPAGRRGLFGALLITGAGVANVVSAGFMTLLGLGSNAFLMGWGWRLPFLFAAVLAVIAVFLRRRLEESNEYLEYTETIELAPEKRKTPLRDALRHPKNLILGILIGLPQSIAGYVVLTFGVGFLVSTGTKAEIGFIGVMIVGVLQIFAAPFWGMVSDRIGRRRLYIIAAIAFVILLFPTFMLFKTDIAIFIWLGMVIGFVIPGVAMQGTLQTMLCEMFDVEARTTGVNVGYQFSNTIGGGFAPLICSALMLAFGSVWPAVGYAALIAAIGVVGTAYASFRPDVENAGRLYEPA